MTWTATNKFNSACVLSTEFLHDAILKRHFLFAPVTMLPKFATSPADEEARIVSQWLSSAAPSFSHLLNTGKVNNKASLFTLYSYNYAFDAFEITWIWKYYGKWSICSFGFSIHKKYLKLNLIFIDFFNIV